MNLQNALELSITQLVNEFTNNPYAFFTEADAVVRFHQILNDSSLLNQTARTKDGFEVTLVHREYPTFFRFSDMNPVERLQEPPARRGHYDTVILNPEFIAAHSAEAVHNRSIMTKKENITPFQAVVEFKLDNVGWSNQRTNGAVAELGKLRLSEESPLKYFIVLMRYNAPTLTRWKKYWPKIEQAAKNESEIGSVIAVHWLSAQKGIEVYRFGRWLSK